MNVEPYPEEEEHRLEEIICQQLVELTETWPKETTETWPKKSLPITNLTLRVVVRLGIPFHIQDGEITIPALLANTLKPYIENHQQRLNVFGNVSISQARLEREAMKQLEVNLYHEISAAVKLPGANEPFPMIIQMEEGDLQDQNKEQLKKLAEKYGVEVRRKWSKQKIRMELLRHRIIPRTIEFYKGETLANLILGNCHTTHERLCVCDKARDTLFPMLRRRDLLSLTRETFAGIVSQRNKIEESRQYQCQKKMNELIEPIYDESVIMEGIYIAILACYDWN